MVFNIPYIAGFLGTLVLTAIGIAVGYITPWFPFIGEQFIYIQIIIIWILMVMLIARLYELALHAHENGLAKSLIFWIAITVAFPVVMYLAPDIRGVFPIYFGLTVFAVGWANARIYRSGADPSDAGKGVVISVLGLIVFGMGVTGYGGPVS